MATAIAAALRALDGPFTASPIGRGETGSSRGVAVGLVGYGRGQPATFMHSSDGVVNVGQQSVTT